MSLFRREVYAHRADDWLGSINLVTSRVGWVLAAMLSLGVLVLMLFLVFGEYTRSESVSGQIVPAGGLIRVSTPHTGTITAVEVGEGVTVEAGQVLAEVSVELDSSQGGRVGEAVAAELRAQKQRLQIELEALDVRQSRELRRLDSRIASLQRQKQLRAEQIVTRRRQLLSAQGLIDQVEPIRSSGQLTAIQIHQFESAALEAEAQVDLAELQHESIELEIDAAEAERQALPASIAEQRSDLSNRLSEISAALARNAGERSVVVRAPLDGTVSGLTVRPGQSVESGRDLLAIVPQASEFVAELWIPARAVGRIEPGGRVAMRYDAFPFRQFGQQYGTIREIGNRALHPDEIIGLSGVSVPEPAYRVLVDLDDQQVVSGSRRSVLRSNMTLQASLRLDRLRLFELIGLRMPGSIANGDVQSDRDSEQRT